MTQTNKNTSKRKTKFHKENNIDKETYAMDVPLSIVYNSEMPTIRVHQLVSGWWNIKPSKKINFLEVNIWDIG